VDRSLSYQQGLAAVSIAVVVLASKSNRLTDLEVLVPKLLTVIETVKSGTVIVLSA
jgi:hypothetical protein